MKCKHVVECQFLLWNKVWSDLSIPSRVIPLPKEFVEWLVNGKFTADTAHSTIEEYEDCDSAFSNEELIGQNDTRIFPELRQQIEQAMDELGGSVIPKLNWSTPKDAVWMNWTGNLKCQESEQVILLLKSSDCIIHDLTEPFSHCEDEREFNEAINNGIEYYLVLRKWVTIEPASEYRCFVSHDKLIGITQRNHQQHFSFLQPHIKDIQKAIEEFYSEHMKSKFSSHTYVFDVYLENLTKDNKVVLVDVNPFGRVTDPLLFSWEELFLIHLAMQQRLNAGQCTSDILTDFRYVAKSIHIQPSLSTSNAKPIDHIDVTSMDGMLELIRLQREQETNSE